MSSKVTMALGCASATFVVLGTLVICKAASLSRIADWEVVAPVVLSDDSQVEVSFRVPSDRPYVADLEVDRLLPRPEMERILCLGWTTETSEPTGMIVTWQLIAGGETRDGGTTPCKGFMEGDEEKVRKRLAVFKLMPDESYLFRAHLDRFDQKLSALHPRIAISLEPLEHKGIVTNAEALQAVGVGLSLVGVIGLALTIRSYRRPNGGWDTLGT